MDFHRHRSHLVLRRRSISPVTGYPRHRRLALSRGDTAERRLTTRFPLNPAGRKAADAWDPARDESAGEQCKAYGVGGVMRLPGRLHVVWQDDRTLTIETDAGSQVRTLRFGSATTGPSDWQGNSQASWDRMAGPMGAGLLFGGGGFGVGNTGAVPLVSKSMKPGYLPRTCSLCRCGEPDTNRSFRSGRAAMRCWVVSRRSSDPMASRKPFLDSTHFRIARRPCGCNQRLAQPYDPAPPKPPSAWTRRLGTLRLAMIDGRGSAAPRRLPFRLSVYWSPLLHED